MDKTENNFFPEFWLLLLIMLMFTNPIPQAKETEEKEAEHDG